MAVTGNSYNTHLQLSYTSASIIAKNLKPDCVLEIVSLTCHFYCLVA